MPEGDSSAWFGALVLFVVIAVIFIRMIPRIMGKQCPKCLRRVPMGKRICPACGATVTARTDLGK